MINKVVTVGQLKKLGACFELGDVCGELDIDSVDYGKHWYEYVNGGDTAFDDSIVKKLAWRKSISICELWVDFNYVVEWINLAGETLLSTGGGLQFNSNVKKWRPHLPSIIMQHGKTVCCIERCEPVDYQQQLEQAGKDLYEVYHSKVTNAPFDGSWITLTKDAQTAWIETAKHIGYSK